MRLKIRDIRKAKGLTIDQVADLSGLSRGFLSQLENGMRQPSAETLGVLAAAFGVQITDLIDGEDEAPDLARLDRLARNLMPDDLQRLVKIAEALADQSPRRTPGAGSGS